MAGKRNYGESCAAAHALDIIGERWALLVVRELVLGPKRFTDLRRGMPNAGPNVLSQRLRELETAGILNKRTLPPPAAAQVYELTDWGRELEPVLQSLGRWGSRSPSIPDAGMSIDAFVLSLRTMFDSATAGDLRLSAELRIEEDTFAIEVEDGELTIERGFADAATTTIEADHQALAGVVYGDLGLHDAETSGAVTVTGDREAVDRFTGCFPLRESAPVPALAGV